MSELDPNLIFDVIVAAVPPELCGNIVISGSLAAAHHEHAAPRRGGEAHRRCARPQRKSTGTLPIIRARSASCTFAQEASLTQVVDSRSRLPYN